MIRVGRVACSKSKAARPAAARDLYTSPLFRGSLRLALATCRPVFVVSALHGLVGLDQVVVPYERTLAELGRTARDAWGERVVARVAERLGDPYPSGVALVLFAGDLYAKPITRAARWRGWTTELPLAGMQIGERLSYLRGAA